MGESTARAKQAIEAFNNDDWDATRELFGNSVYNELGTQRSLAGADAIVQALQGWKAAMPDVKGTVTSAVEDGQTAVLEVVWEGTQTGEMVTAEGTIPPSGKHQKTPSAFIFEFENGKLKESRNYFDVLTLLKQIGAA
jgi:steroid delta-isomerase-like uncharacterized protein